MKKRVGLWIDHRQAFIVIKHDREEEIKRITSDFDNPVPHSDERFEEQLNRYYDEVISYLRDAHSILVLGPGEAKVEIQKRLENHILNDRIVTIRPADKMTDDQIAAEVHHYFREPQHGSNGTAHYQQQTAKQH